METGRQIASLAVALALLIGGSVPCGPALEDTAASPAGMHQPGMLQAQGQGMLQAQGHPAGPEAAEEAHAHTGPHPTGGSTFLDAACPCGCGDAAATAMPHRCGPAVRTAVARLARPAANQELRRRSPAPLDGPRRAVDHVPRPSRTV